MGAVCVHGRACEAWAAVLLTALLGGCGGRLVVGDVQHDAAPRADVGPPDDAGIRTDGGAEDAQADATRPCFAADGAPLLQWSLDYRAPLAGVIAVHGVAEDDAWAVGSWPPRHWDGTSWTEIPGGPSFASALWAVGADDVWAANGDGLWHWDGFAWTRGIQPGYVPFIWGLASDDVWTAGNAGLLHWDGTTWTVVYSGINLYGASGVAADDVWIAGCVAPCSSSSDGRVVHWDGVAFEQVANPPVRPRAILALAADSVWVGGLGGAAHWDGTGWKLYDQPDGVTMLAGRSPDNVWAGFSWPMWHGGGLSHFDGVSWTAPPDVATGVPAALWVTPTGDTWAVDESGRWLQHDASGWSVRACGAGTPATACASSDADAWVFTAGAGGACALHRDAAGWSGDALVGMDVLAAWCHAADDVWVVGGGNAVRRWNGSTWAEVPSPFGAPAGCTPWAGIWGTAGDDVWAVGTNIHTYECPVFQGYSHWDGAAWTAALAQGWWAVTGVWASARDDAWLAGVVDSTEYPVAVTHWDGQSWDASPTLLPSFGPAGQYRAPPVIWGSSAADVWVVGAGVDGALGCSFGAVERWDGAAWRIPDLPACVAGWQGCCPGSGRGFSGELKSVTGTAADDVWLLEGGDRVWHWDGATWCESRAPDGLLAQGLTSIRTATRGRVWGFGPDTVVRIGQ
jgi:hypothetical protein